MRNLKKVLSLALALVMLLGMMVVGAGAATDYTDADQISNLQAAEVADALGIIEGNAGQFMPTVELDRAQAAQIIARMMLTPEVAKTLKATGNEFSDTQGHWAAAAINYCAQNGIVEGNGAGSFFPDTKVTGYQFAKMLLVALGYDAAIEGYNGSGWRTNVAIDALRAGLTQNVQVSDAILTRDAAVQMVLNCLTADVMEYSLKSDGFGLIGTMTNNKTNYRTSVGNVTGNSSTPAGSNKGVGTMQFCELHFPQLKLIEGDTDVFGNITASWKIVKGNTTETISTTDVAYAQQYTALTTAAKIYSDLGMTAEKSNIPYYVDGVAGTTTINSWSQHVVGGNGALTTVWTNENGDPLRITVKNTYVGDVAGVNSDGTVTIAPRLGTEKVGTLKTTGLSVGDAVLYTQAGVNKTIITAEKVEAVSGTLTGFTQRSESSNAYGRTLPVNGNATLGTDTAEYSDKVATAVADGTLTRSLGRTVSIIKDTYGYVLYVSENAPVGNYAFVIGHSIHPTRGDVFQAIVATQTGAIETWMVTNNNVADNMTDKLVRYSVSGGVYTLAAASGANDFDSVTAAAAKCAIAPTPANTEMTTKGYRNVNVYGAAPGTADSTTVFIVRRGLNSFETYQGIANVPTMRALKETSTASILDTAGIVRAVYIDARENVSFNGSMDDVVYILKQNSVVGDGNGYYGVYTAVVNGQKVTDFKANAGLTPKTLYTYSKLNEKTGVTQVETIGKSTDGTVKVQNTAVNLGVLGGFTYNNLTRAFVVDENNQLNEYSIYNVPTTDRDKVWYADVAGVLSLIVIEKGNAGSGSGGGAVGTTGTVDPSMLRVNVTTKATATADDVLKQAIADLEKAGYTVNSTTQNGAEWKINTTKDGVSREFNTVTTKMLAINATMAPGSEGAVAADKTQVATNSAGATDTVTLTVTGLPEKSTVTPTLTGSDGVAPTVAYKNGGSAVGDDGKATITLTVTKASVNADVANIAVSVRAADKAVIAAGSLTGFTTVGAFDPATDRTHTLTVAKDNTSGNTTTLLAYYTSTDGDVKLYSDAACENQVTVNTDAITAAVNYWVKVVGDASHADSDVIAIKITVQKATLALGSDDGDYSISGSTITMDSSIADAKISTLLSNTTVFTKGGAMDGSVKAYTDEGCTTEVGSSDEATTTARTIYVKVTGSSTHDDSAVLTITVVKGS